MNPDRHHALQDPTPVFSIALVLACGPTVVEDLEIEFLESELLSPDPVSGVVSLSDLGMLVNSQEGLELRHPLSSQSTWVWDRPGELWSAVRSQELGLVVSTEHGLLAGHGLLGPSPLQDQLIGVGRVFAAGDGMVIETSEGVHAWRAGELFAFNDFAAPIATSGDGDIYLQQAKHRVHFVRSGVGWAELDRETDRSYGRGLDGQGVLWTLGDKGLTRSDGLAWRLPTELLSLHVCAQNSGAWVVDDQGSAWFFDTQVRVRAQVPEGAVLDGQCRWLVADSQGLERLSWARPVALWGLEEGEQLLGDTPVVVLPTLPELVESVLLSVNGEDQVLVDDGWVLELADWPAGGTMEVVVRYQDSVSSTLQRTFEAGDAGRPTWSEDLEFLYKDHCALCHTNGTETVLAEAQDWEDNIETILTSVSSGTMPLGKTPLTGAQIATIRAWRDGGFE